MRLLSSASQIAQVGFIPRMVKWFNLIKSIDIILYITSSKEVNQMNIPTDAENTF